MKTYKIPLKKFLAICLAITIFQSAFLPDLFAALIKNDIVTVPVENGVKPTEFVEKKAVYYGEDQKGVLQLKTIIDNTYNTVNEELDTKTITAERSDGGFCEPGELVTRDESNVPTSISYNVNGYTGTLNEIAGTYIYTSVGVYNNGTYIGFNWTRACSYSGEVSKLILYQYLEGAVDLVYEGLAFTVDELEETFGPNAPNSKACADPVNIATGNYYAIDNDLTIQDIGLLVNANRYYNSLDTEEGLLGKGWKFGYESYVTINTNKVKVHYPDGHTVVFTLDTASNTYTAPKAFNDQLIKNTDNTFSLKLENNQTYHYNTNGLIDSIKDANNNKITIMYNTNNKIKSIISPSGKVISVTVVNNRITQITDPIGRFVKYNYDANNRLNSVQTNQGTSTYTYDSNGITSATDFNGKKYIENQYDEFGRVIWQKDGEGNISTFEYNEAYLSNSFIVEATGAETQYEYNTDMYVTKIIYSDHTFESFSYDEQGNKITSRNRNGRTTTYTYDSKGNVTSITSPAPYNYVTSFTYDLNKNITKITNPDGGEQRFTYDDKGNLLQSQVKLNTTITATTNFTYDNSGRILTKTDAENNVTTYEYEATSSSPTKITDPEGNITIYTYDEVNRVKTITTGYGTSILAYSNGDKVEKIIDPLGNVSKMKYDAMGNLIKRINPEQYEQATDDGKGYNFTYDAMDRLIRQTDPLSSIVAVKYDALGNKRKEVNPNYYSETTGDGTGVSYEYDKDSRKVKIINPSGEVSRLKYDAVGNVIMTIDANNYDETSDSGKGMHYTYDELNRLIQIKDTEGQVVNRFVYDSMGRIVKDIDAEGYLSGSSDNACYGTEYKYNLDGWLLEKREPLKKEGSTIYYNVTKYEYDNIGRVIKEYRSPDYVTLTGVSSKVNVISYTYDGNSKIKTISDSTGAYMEYTYDSLGNVIEQKTKLNEEDYQLMGYEYDALGRVIRQWIELSADDLAEEVTGTVQAETSYEYDKNGNLIKGISPEGYKTEFTYDDANRMISMVEEVSEDWLNETHVEASVESPMSKVYEGQTYDYKVTIDPDEAVTGFDLKLDYDARVFEVISTTPNTNITINTSTIGQIVIEGNSQLIDAATEVATLSLRVKTGFIGIGYITINNTSTYKDADNISKTFTELEGQSADLSGPDMNNDGNVEANDLTLTALEKGKDTSNPLFEYQFDINGNSRVDTEDLDYISDWIFNNRSDSLTALDNQLFTQKIITPKYEMGTNTVIRTTTYTYDKAGNLISESDGSGNNSTYTYDANNNLIKTTDKEGNINRYFYDEMGNITKEVLPTNYKVGTDNGVGMNYIYDSMGHLIRVLDEAGIVIQAKVYNSKGYLIKEVDADGYLSGLTDESRYGTTYIYDIGGRLIAISTPEAKMIGEISASYTYDALNNVLTYTDGENHTKTYERDLWGRATKITNAKNISEYYTFDSVGNLTSSEDGMGNITVYTYNSMNLLKSVTDPEGNSITYEYDREGRLVQEMDKKGQVIRYAYNSDNNLTSKSIIDGNLADNYLYNKEGSLFAAITKNGIERYQYTKNGYLNKQILNGREQLSYTYNSNGQVTQRTNYEGESTIYGYNVLGRLETVSDGVSNLATYAYNNDNTVSKITYDTGVKTNYNYDKNNQVTNLTHKQGNGSLINSFSYAYDNNGNITSKTENGQSTSYQYDEINQLVEADYPDVGVETYMYDDAGNRLQKTVSGVTTTYTYNSLNQLTGSSENDIMTLYDYDLNGNMTKETTGSDVTTNIYDGFNRLKETQNADGSWQKNHYNAFDLRSAVEENGIYTSFIYDGSNVVEELNVHDKTTSTYMRGYGLIASEDMVGRNNYYLQNSHTDIIGILDKKGVVKNRYTYDAFGNITQSEELIKNRFTYAGEQFDSLTGNYYLRARYYNPTIGRFLQEDTFRGDGLNLYTYVANNPIMFVDPSGHAKCGKKEEEQADKAYMKWWDAHHPDPELLYEGDPRYTIMTVVAFQDKLLYMASKGTDVSKLSVEQLNKLFEDEAKFQAGATTAMFGAAIGITKNIVQIPVIKINPNAFDRGIKNTSDLKENMFSNLKDNGIVSVNRSGSDRPVTSTPNSYYKTANGESVFVYDGKGNLIYDISSTRIKGFDINVGPEKISFNPFKLDGNVPLFIKKMFGW